MGRRGKMARVCAAGLALWTWSYPGHNKAAVGGGECAALGLMGLRSAGLAVAATLGGCVHVPGARISRSAAGFKHFFLTFQTGSLQTALRGVSEGRAHRPWRPSPWVSPFVPARAAPVPRPLLVRPASTATPPHPPPISCLLFLCLSLFSSSSSSSSSLSLFVCCYHLAVNVQANALRVQHVEKCFGTSGVPLRKQGRMLLGEGVLTKVCRKGPKPRQFFLFNDILVYGNIVQDKRKYNKQHILPLEDVGIINLPDAGELKNAWQVTSRQKSFVLMAATAREKAEWVQHLCHATKRPPSNDPSIREDRKRNKERRKDDDDGR